MQAVAVCFVLGRSHLWGRTGQRFVPSRSFFLPPENPSLATQTFDFREPAMVE